MNDTIEQGIPFLEQYRSVWINFRSTSELSFRRMRLSAAGLDYLTECWQHHVATTLPGTQPHVQRIYLCIDLLDVDTATMQAFLRLVQSIHDHNGGLPELFVEACGSTMTLLRGLCNARRIQKLTMISHDLRGSVVGTCLDQLFSSFSISNNSHACPLQELNMGLCQIDEAMYGGFLRGLACLKSQLRTLTISHWDLDNEQLQELVEALLEDPTDFISFNNNDTLRVLGLCDQNLTSGAFSSSLSRILNQFSGLEVLSVSNSGSTTLFRESSVVDETETDERGREPTDDTVYADFSVFTTALARNRSLETLLIPDFRFNNDYGCLLFQALEVNTTLASLSVGRDLERVSKALILSLPKWQGLRVLWGHISDCRLDIRSPLFDSDFLSAFRQNTSLIDIKCEVCDLCDVPLRSLRWILQRNQILNNKLPLYTEQRHLLNATIFPYCVINLQNEECRGDVSAVYALLSATTIDLMSWTSASNA